MLAAHGAKQAPPGAWSVPATVAHNSEFKDEQLLRLTAARQHREPPAFAPVDHADPAVYQRYAQATPAAAAGGCRRVTDALIAALAEVSDEDLTDPQRNPWLAGRPLWLQTIVRGFWHPVGHVSDGYHERGEPHRALALCRHVAATASYLDAPAPVCGMATYLLACTEARLGMTGEALGTLTEAIRLNPQVRGNAATDPDLEILRKAGTLAPLLA